MTLEFQTELLQFLVQNPSGKKYIEILESKLFDAPEQQLAFDVIQSFYTKYNSAPSLANVLEFFSIQANETSADIGPDIYKTIEDSLRESFEPFSGNAEFIRERIVSNYQLKLMKDMFADKMLDLKNGGADVIAEIYQESKKIKNLSSYDEEEENNKGRFALAEFKKGQRTEIEATGTYLDTLNSMTSTRGFYSPQLVILMGAPKSFKTGTSLNLAVNFVRSGKKVYYVDCENGEDRILDRFYQCMLEATWEEYNSGSLDDTLEEMIKRYAIMKGDFRSDFYPANTKSMADVEDRLQALKEESGWEPGIIIYDYLDLMRCEDHTVKEKRLIIQAVYHDAIRLQKRRNIFGMSPSQVNKEAVSKAVIDMTGFAEDFGKAANCHAAFALCRTPEEREAGVMRIVPVLQRDGEAQGNNACFVEVEEAKMSVKEIDKDEWKFRVEEVTAANNPKGSSRARKPVKNLKDE